MGYMNYTTDFKKQVVADYNNGLPAMDVAVKHGVSIASVMKWDKDASLNTNQPSLLDQPTPKKAAQMQTQEPVRIIRQVKSVDDEIVNMPTFRNFAIEPDEAAEWNPQSKFQLVGVNNSFRRVILRKGLDYIKAVSERQILETARMAQNAPPDKF